MYGSFGAFYNGLRFVRCLFGAKPDPLPEPKSPIEQGATFSRQEADQLVLFDIESYGERV